MIIQKIASWGTVGLMISGCAFAQEEAKVITIDDLIANKWGTSQTEYMKANKDKYDKPYQDKGANFFISKDHMMIDDLSFKQIVRMKDKKELSSINYMNISNKENFEASCKKIYDFIEKTYAKPTFQALNDGPTLAFNVWIDLKGTTMYQFCFSESELQTIIITVEPKWKTYQCQLDNKQEEYHYFVDEMNNQIREYSPNYISNVLKSTINANKIEFTTEKAPSQISIDQKSLKFTLKSEEGKTEIGHCTAN